MAKSRVRSQVETYQKQLLAHGDHPTSLFQTLETQTLRFDHMMQRILETSAGGFTLHDVGCGLGHLHEYLNKKKVKHRYSGSDIVPEAVALFHQKFPKLKVKCADFLSLNTNKKYDFVVCNGILHFPAGTDSSQWRNFGYKLIKHMFTNAKKGVAFNFLTTYKTTENHSLFYFDPKDVFDFSQKHLSRFVHLDHAYPLYEATITVFTKEYMQTRFKQATFKKYFR
ncbi:MAG: class I SAM-dependent methyltransferase [Oligoflexia bacterium]|nr:class I SAM-dependent methyltransferase [Oligoflexia bacterium]